jgi:hypothetical protein
VGLQWGELKISLFLSIISQSGRVDNKNFEKIAQKLPPPLAGAVGQIPFSPLLHIPDDVNETRTQRGQGIFHPWGDLLIVMADQESVGLQFPELLCKGGLRDLPELAAQSAEPVNVVKGDIVEDLKLPFPAQYLLKGRHGFAALDCRFCFLISATSCQPIVLPLHQKSKVLQKSTVLLFSLCHGIMAEK